MDITISCCDGNLVCDQDAIIQHSNILSEVEVCSCNCDVILPDLNMDLVRLAISFLERGKSDVMELAKDLYETVAPVYSLLNIHYILIKCRRFHGSRLVMSSGNLECIM